MQIARVIGMSIIEKIVSEITRTDNSTNGIDDVGDKIPGTPLEQRIDFQCVANTLKRAGTYVAWKLTDCQSCEI